MTKIKFIARKKQLSISVFLIAILIKKINICLISIHLYAIIIVRSDK